MIRKIVKVGNSDGVTIPVGVMRANKLKAGDKVEVYFGKPGGDVKYLEILKEIENFNNAHKRTKHLLKR